MPKHKHKHDHAPDDKEHQNTVDLLRSRLTKSLYNDDLARYQFELVRLQYWVKERGQRVVIIFEGRDAAGKGGTIKRIVDPMNPRGVRLVALGRCLIVSAPSGSSSATSSICPRRARS